MLQVSAKVILRQMIFGRKFSGFRRFFRFSSRTILDPHYTRPPSVRMSYMNGPSLLLLGELSVCWVGAGDVGAEAVVLPAHVEQHDRAVLDRLKEKKMEKIRLVSFLIW